MPWWNATTTAWPALEQHGWTRVAIPRKHSGKAEDKWYFPPAPHDHYMLNSVPECRRFLAAAARGNLDQNPWKLRLNKGTAYKGRKPPGGIKPKPKPKPKPKRAAGGAGKKAAAAKKPDKARPLKDFVGRAVRKKFGGAWFGGTVVKARGHAGGAGLVHVRYEDGDEEDLDVGELMALLEANKKQQQHQQHQQPQPQQTPSQPPQPQPARAAAKKKSGRRRKGRRNNNSSKKKKETTTKKGAASAQRTPSPVPPPARAAATLLRSPQPRRGLGRVRLAR